MNGGRILTFRDPSDDGYRDESTPGDLRAVPIASLGGVRVDLSALFD